MKDYQPIPLMPDKQPGDGTAGNPFAEIFIPEGIDFIACENDRGAPLLFGASGGRGSLVRMETGSVLGLARGARRFSLGCRIGDDQDTMQLPATALPQLVGLTAEAALIYQPQKKEAKALLPIQKTINNVAEFTFARTAGTFKLSVKNPTVGTRIWLATITGEAAKNDAGGAHNTPLDAGEAVDWEGPLFAFQNSGAAVLLSIVEHNIPLL